MAFQVVVGGVVHLVAMAVDGADVHLPVREADPHVFGRPVVHAYHLIQDVGVGGSGRFAVGVLAEGEHMQVEV